MKISINGESHEFVADTSLPELLTQYGAREPYVVAVNAELVHRPHYEQAVLNEGDQVDVIQPIQGG